MKFTPGTPKPPGSGRKKGTKNKNSIPPAELADLLGINPYEVLLHLAAGNASALGWSKVPPELRARAESEATRYLHAQRRSVDVSIKEPIRVIIEEYKAEKSPQKPIPIDPEGDPS